MFNNLKDQIFYEEFNSNEEFNSAFQKKYDELNTMLENFNGFSSYSDDELLNNEIEVKIQEEFEEFITAIKAAIETIETDKGAIR